MSYILLILVVFYCAKQCNQSIFPFSLWVLLLYFCRAHRTAICKAKRGGFKDTYADDLLAPVLKVCFISRRLCVEIVVLKINNEICDSTLAY